MGCGCVGTGARHGVMGGSQIASQSGSPYAPGIVLIDWAHFTQASPAQQTAIVNCMGRPVLTIYLLLNALVGATANTVELWTILDNHGNKTRILSTAMAGVGTATLARVGINSDTSVPIQNQLYVAWTFTGSPTAYDLNVSIAG
jgi:hypothetical protein